MLADFFIARKQVLSLAELYNSANAGCKGVTCGKPLSRPASPTASVVNGSAVGEESDANVDDSDYGDHLFHDSKVGSIDSPANNRGSGELISPLLDEDEINKRTSLTFFAQRSMGALTREGFVVVCCCRLLFGIEDTCGCCRSIAFEFALCVKAVVAFVCRGESDSSIVDIA